MSAQNTKVAQTVGAWVPDWEIKSYGLAVFVESIARKSELARLGFANHDMSGSGWVRVGTAKIEVELVPPDSLAAEELRSLNKQLDELREVHRQAQQAILDRISKLQALPFDGAVS